MHYLECVALLSYLLKKLQADKRVQVPVSILNDVMTVLIGVNKKLESELDNQPLIRVRLEDAMGATQTIRAVEGITYLTDTMKNSLVSGVTELQQSICLLAYDYFELHDFEPTEKIIPVLRIVVQAHLERS